MAANFDPTWTNYDGIVFHCTFEGCTKVYKYAKSCYDHYRNSHVQRPRSVCKHCNQEFIQQKTLSRHLASNACKAKRVEVWNLDEARQDLLQRSTKRTQKTDPQRRNRMQPKDLPEPLTRLLSEYETNMNIGLGTESHESGLGRSQVSSEGVHDSRAVSSQWWRGARFSGGLKLAVKECTILGRSQVRGDRVSSMILGTVRGEELILESSNGKDVWFLHVCVHIVLHPVTVK